MQICKETWWCFRPSATTCTDLLQGLPTECGRSLDCGVGSSPAINDVCEHRNTKSGSELQNVRHSSKPRVSSSLISNVTFNPLPLM
jgi:hypothetical protein